MRESRVARTGRAVGAALAAVLVLGGCATADRPAGETAGEGAYRCWETAVPDGVLESGVTADRLSEEGRAALDGLEVPPIDPAEWSVVEDGAERVALLRALDQPEDLGSGDVRTHEMLVIELTDATDVDPVPTWSLTAAQTCALRADLGGLGTATLTLDPEHPPASGAREVHLLVTEMACNSGQDAEGRVRLSDLAVRDDAIAVTVGVEPRTGVADCPSNPPTPFVVELDEPLGDRVVLDASVHPAREVVLP
ncbi:hypothetical protein JOE63_000106 [Cellulosimicrobium cellulans]|uniref:hypothetical protein n=1 Tax=Cellulosimicrobium cellulans TaxID=1710 RepID=UPI00195EFB03|nr:hypothetical protein [Cellulosimicrobium cellulans]MBM7817629.1 hypothetical protein [Cellulosimicrobium cellulans]